MVTKQIEEYGWNSVEGPHSCAYISPEIVSILERLNVNRVLDIGCGNGALSRTLGDKGYDVVGIDMDSRGLEFARSASPQTTYYQFGVEDDPSQLLGKEAKFDVVISTEVLEHLYYPTLLLSYSKAVLEDDGYLVLSTPYHVYLKNLVISVLNKWDSHFTSLRPGGHIKFFSKKPSHYCWKEMVSSL